MFIPLGFICATAILVYSIKRFTMFLEVGTYAFAFRDEFDCFSTDGTKVCPFWYCMFTLRNKHILSCNMCPLQGISSIVSHLISLQLFWFRPQLQCRAVRLTRLLSRISQRVPCCQV